MARTNLLAEEEEWLSEWFVFLRPWSKRDVNGRRKVWMSIYGIPLHGWKKEIFMEVGSRFGKVVEVHQITEGIKDFRKGMVLINTPKFEVIRRKASVRIAGETYGVNVVEEIHPFDFNMVWGSSRWNEAKETNLQNTETGRRNGDFFSGYSSDEYEEEEENEISDWDDASVDDQGIEIREEALEMQDEEILERLEKLGKMATRQDRRKNDDEVLASTKTRVDTQTPVVNEEIQSPKGVKKSSLEKIEKNKTKKDEEKEAGGVENSEEQEHITDEQSRENESDQGTDSEDPDYDGSKDEVMQEDELILGSDPFELQGLIDKALNKPKRTVAKKKVAKSQQTRNKEWKEFIGDLNSAGKSDALEANRTTRQGKGKGNKRGRPRKNESRKAKKGKGTGAELGNARNGDRIVSVQVSHLIEGSCNVIRKSVDSDVGDFATLGMNLGLLQAKEAEKASGMFAEWEKRDQTGAILANLDSSGVGSNKCG